MSDVKKLKQMLKDYDLVDYLTEWSDMYMMLNKLNRHAPNTCRDLGADKLLDKIKYKEQPFRGDQ
jgi:hypothetical protein|tara:strand:- start:144 stop:338 length:195 start_codon:yes stop_codon:yes gene_type:complete